MVLEAEPFETMRYTDPEKYEEEKRRLDTWHPPLEPLKELAEAKPPDRPDPVLPDMLIYREVMTDRGTPQVVSERLRDLREERARVAEMWNREGKTRVYIPNTAEARKMKLQAKLHNRLDLKHVEVVKKELTERVRKIEIPPDAVVAKAEEL